ncbi:MAG: hypothetical protein EBR82_62090 [Caulobacteraceae bacterium]|nr:hypothetical protein [Caulobacteraceae bacterium]
MTHDDAGPSVASLGSRVVQTGTPDDLNGVKPITVHEMWMRLSIEQQRNLLARMNALPKWCRPERHILLRAVAFPWVFAQQYGIDRGAFGVRHSIYWAWRWATLICFGL